MFPYSSCPCRCLRDGVIKAPCTCAVGGIVRGNDLKNMCIERSMRVHMVEWRRNSKLP